MDDKKHTMTRKNEQLPSKGISANNLLPAANRLSEKTEWPEISVEHSTATKDGVPNPNLLCVLRMVQGVATERILSNCTIGGLRKAVYVGTFVKIGIEQFRLCLRKFALYLVQRDSERCKEPVAGSGCGGLLPILLTPVAV